MSHRDSTVRVPSLPNSVLECTRPSESVPLADLAAEICFGWREEETELESPASPSWGCVTAKTPPSPNRVWCLFSAKGAPSSTAWGNAPGIRPISKTKR